MLNEKHIDIYNNIKLLSQNSVKPFSELYPLIDKELNKLRVPHDQYTILITQLNGIGDLILISGLIKNIRYNFPDSFIILAYHGFRKEVYENCPYIDKIVSCYTHDTSLQALYNIVLNLCLNELWQYSIDLAISPHWGQTATQASFINWLSGAKERVGFPINPERKYFQSKYTTDYWAESDDYNSILTKIIEHPREIIHDVDRKYWLLSANNWKIYDKRLEIWLSDNDYVPLNVTNKKIIVGLGASNNTKKYPIRKLSKVLAKINELDDVTFILVGNNNEVIDAEYLINKNPNLKFVNYCNKLTIKQTASIIKQSDLYLGNDTCLVHIAKIYDLPTISIICENKDVYNEEGFEALSSYLRFRPWQMDCKHQSIVLRPEHALPGCEHSLVHAGCFKTEAHCITQITPDEIVQAYKNIK